MNAAPSLAARTLTRGLGWKYFAETPGMPLSLKCMANGRARYLVAGREFTVDDGGWLVVNERRPYSIEIDSPTLVETFIIWFPRGWAEEVWRGAATPDERLLAEAPESRGPEPELFESYTLNDPVVAPALHQLRAARRRSPELDGVWLEQRLRGLLARLLEVQRGLRAAAARLPAVRRETREELWRRVSRARDFIHARCDTALSLAPMAQAAALSPYHFLRTFRAAFGETPHEWLCACRIDRAKFLLERTDLPVTEVCLAVGYESLGSFSAGFRRRTGRSPREWRRERGRRRLIRNFREVFPAPA